MSVPKRQKIVHACYCVTRLVLSVQRRRPSFNDTGIGLMAWRTRKSFFIFLRHNCARFGLFRGLTANYTVSLRNNAFEIGLNLTSLEDLKSLEQVVSISRVVTCPDVAHINPA